jgi:hypothetical protein
MEKEGRKKEGRGEGTKRRNGGGERKRELRVGIRIKGIKGEMRNENGEREWLEGGKDRKELGKEK